MTDQSLQYLEVEQKYSVPDPGALRQRLTDLGGKPGEPVRQVDTYLNAPDRDFLAPPVISEWLRLRETGQGSSVNYKLWLPEDAPQKTHCDEYESPVGDLEAVRRMFTALGYRQIAIVDKTRVEWTLPDGLVLPAIDTVAGLGTFAEFEHQGPAGSVEEAVEQLQAWVDQLGVELGERIHRGYPHMVLGRDR